MAKSEPEFIKKLYEKTTVALNKATPKELYNIFKSREFLQKAEDDFLVNHKNDEIAGALACNAALHGDRTFLEYLSGQSVNIYSFYQGVNVCNFAQTEAITSYLNMSHHV